MVTKVPMVTIISQSSHLSASSTQDMESLRFCSCSARRNLLNLNMENISMKMTMMTLSYLMASCLTSCMNCLLTVGGPCKVANMSQSSVCPRPGFFTSL